jgi:hypothetical protein
MRDRGWGVGIYRREREREEFGEMDGGKDGEMMRKMHKSKRSKM